MLSHKKNWLSSIKNGAWMGLFWNRICVIKFKLPDQDRPSSSVSKIVPDWYRLQWASTNELIPSDRTSYDRAPWLIFKLWWVSNLYASKTDSNPLSGGIVRVWTDEQLVNNLLRIANWQAFCVNGPHLTLSQESLLYGGASSELMGKINIHHEILC